MTRFCSLSTDHILEVLLPYSALMPQVAGIQYEAPAVVGLLRSFRGFTTPRLASGRRRSVCPEPSLHPSTHTGHWCGLQLPFRPHSLSFNRHDEAFPVHCRFPSWPLLHVSPASLLPSSSCLPSHGLPSSFHSSLPSHSSLPLRSPSLSVYPLTLTVTS